VWRAWKQPEERRYLLRSPCGVAVGGWLDGWAATMGVAARGWATWRLRIAVGLQYIYFPENTANVSYFVWLLCLAGSQWRAAM